MRTLRLARIAAEAEGIRLRERTQRAATRIALGFIAMGFLFAAIIFIHIAAWYSLRLYLQEPFAALVVAGGDIVLAGVIALVAARSSPGRVELEAMALRQQAWQSAIARVGYSAMVMELVRTVTSLLWRSRSRS